jgi:hypothetical protein
MEGLSRLVFLEGCALLLGFFAIVVFKIATGKISLEWLLYTKPRTRPKPRAEQGVVAEPADKKAPSSFSPARLQLLIFTVAVALQYLHAILVNPQRDSLPDLPQGVVAALGGSQAVYLAGKAISTYIQPLHRKPDEEA